MMHPHTWPRRMWGSLREPRAITATIVALYVTSVLCGVGIVYSAMEPDALHVIPAPIKLAAGAVLAIAGLVGAPSAWRGAWWLERGAALGIIVGGVSLGLELVDSIPDALHQYPHGLLIMALYGCACTVALGVTRFLRVRDLPYAPGRGPLPLAVREAAARAVMAGEEEAECTPIS